MTKAQLTTQILAVLNPPEVAVESTRAHCMAQPKRFLVTRLAQLQTYQAAKGAR